MDGILCKMISPVIKTGLGFNEVLSLNKEKVEGETKQVEETKKSNIIKGKEIVGQ